MNFDTINAGMQAISRATCSIGNGIHSLGSGALNLTIRGVKSAVSYILWPFTCCCKRSNDEGSGDLTGTVKDIPKGTPIRVVPQPPSSQPSTQYPIVKNFQSTPNLVGNFFGPKPQAQQVEEEAEQPQIQQTTPTSSRESPVPFTQKLANGAMSVAPFAYGSIPGFTIGMMAYSWFRQNQDQKDEEPKAQELNEDQRPETLRLENKDVVERLQPSPQAYVPGAREQAVKKFWLTSLNDVSVKNPLEPFVATTDRLQ